MIDWDLLWKALGVIVPTVLALAALYASRRKDLDQKLQDGDDRMDRHEGRIAWLEQTIQSMPGKDDTHRLEILLAEMAGDMKAMRTAMDGMRSSLQRTEDIVGRHEDHLRSNH